MKVKLGLALVFLGCLFMVSSCSQRIEEESIEKISTDHLKRISLAATVETQSDSRWIYHLDNGVPKVSWDKFSMASIIFLHKEGDPNTYCLRHIVFWKVVSAEPDGKVALYPYSYKSCLVAAYTVDGHPSHKESNLERQEAKGSARDWEMINARDMGYFGKPRYPVPKLQAGDKWYAVAVSVPGDRRIVDPYTRTMTLSPLDMSYSPLEYTFDENQSSSEEIFRMSNWKEFVVDKHNSLHLSFDFTPPGAQVMIRVHNRLGMAFPSWLSNRGRFFDVYLTSRMSGEYNVEDFNPETDLGKHPKWTPYRRLFDRTDPDTWGAGLTLSPLRQGRYYPDIPDPLPFENGETRTFVLQIPEIALDPSSQNRLDNSLVLFPDFNRSDPAFKNCGFRVKLGDVESKFFQGFPIEGFKLKKGFEAGKFYTMDIFLEKH